MKIISWNINSIRLRLHHLKTISELENPDIICLQETKVKDELFPADYVKSLGYEHIYFRGEKSYNGVAILSKIPFLKRDRISLINESARHISVILPNDIELHNFYIPAGGDEPDPISNSKFKYKLDYIDLMTNWFLTNKNVNSKIILVGDLNVAPLEHDVWSHKQLLNVISHTPIEVEKFTKLFNSLNFIDCHRKFIHKSEKLYSWWSYRNQDWKKSNRGRRLDHIWTSGILDDKIKNSIILKNARDWELPSDHVPIITEFR